MPAMEMALLTGQVTDFIQNRQSTALLTAILTFKGGSTTVNSGLWDGLDQRLRLDGIIAQTMRSRSRVIVLNRNGEAVDQSPESIAQFVAAGNVWIDWTGEPMRFVSIFSPVFDDTQFEGFDRFLEQAGIRASDPGGTIAAPLFKLPLFSPIEWLYPRSMFTSTNMDIYPKFKANPAAPRRTGPGVDAFIYSSFRIKHGDGLYFYAFGDGAEGINIENYVDFIRDEIIGNVPPTPTPTPTPTPQNLRVVVRYGVTPRISTTTLIILGIAAGGILVLLTRPDILGLGRPPQETPRRRGTT